MVKQLTVSGLIKKLSKINPKCKTGEEVYDGLGIPYDFDWKTLVNDCVKDKPKPLNNKFKVSLQISFPKSAGLDLTRYINYCHTGKEDLPMDYPQSKEHEAAHHMLHHSREIELEFSADKNGKWSFIGINKDLD